MVEKKKKFRTSWKLEKRIRRSPEAKSARSPLLAREGADSGQKLRRFKKEGAVGKDSTKRCGH